MVVFDTYPAPGAGSAGRRLWLGALPSLSPGPDVAGAYSKQIQSAYAKASASAQASIQSATGIDTTNKTLTQGATSAAGLMQNGYNPDSKADNANLVHAIAGGVALIPGAGPFVAGALEGLWLVGNQIACPVANAFASIGLGSRCDAPPCATSGNWSTASVLAANRGALPPGWSGQGTFTSLVIPALAYASAMLGNCQQTPPADVIVDACVNIWNQTHEGGALPVFIPALIVQPGTLSEAPGLLIAGAGEKITGTTPAAKAGLHPNVFYAFQPIIDGWNAQYGGVDWTKPPTKDQPYWLPFGGSGPFQSGTAAVPPGMARTLARVVYVNAGKVKNPVEQNPAAWAAVLAYLATQSTPTPSTSLSTGGKVAATAGAVTGAALIGVGILAWAKGETFKWALGKTWKTVSEPFKHKRRRR